MILNSLCVPGRMTGVEESVEEGGGGTETSLRSLKTYAALRAIGRVEICEGRWEEIDKDEEEEEEEEEESL